MAGAGLVVIGITLVIVGVLLRQAFSRIRT
jgi:hypothetical protein